MEKEGKSFPSNYSGDAFMVSIIALGLRGFRSGVYIHIQGFNAEHFNVIVFSLI